MKLKLKKLTFEIVEQDDKTFDPIRYHRDQQQQLKISLILPDMDGD